LERFHRYGAAFSAIGRIEEERLTDFQAAVLGFIQGFTEWLPISSTAHLRVVPELCGWKDPGSAFTAVSQLGTLLAALVYFRRDIYDILSSLFCKPEPGEDRVDRKLLVPIVIGTIPVIVCGVAFKQSIRGPLRSLWVVAGAMVLFALLLAAAEARQTRRRGIQTVTWLDGLAVGIGQAFSLIPGASRSGTTITAALFMGMERAAAARFSFLLSLPAIFAAGAFELLEARHEILQGGLGRPTLIATAVAFFVGWASIDWLMKFLRRHPTYLFILYRLVVGGIILSLLAAGVLKPFGP
jgi:undecaprenyl-diphosphatase